VHDNLHDATRTSPPTRATTIAVPLRRRGPHPAWLIAGALLLIAIILPFDVAIGSFIGDIAAPGTWLRRGMKLPVHLFKWPVFIALGAVLLLHRERARVLRTYLITLGGCFAALYTLKFVIGRVRPDLGCGPYYLCPFGNPAFGFDSFPSGHTTQVVLLTTLLALYFPRTRYFVIPLATLAAVSRIALERHFMTDVIGGVALALLSVYIVARFSGPGAFPCITRRSLALGRFRLWRPTPRFQPSSAAV
jgi:membrane-associated phospholipid phosphatase